MASDPEVDSAAVARARAIGKLLSARDLPSELSEELQRTALLSGSSELVTPVIAPELRVSNYDLRVNDRCFSFVLS